MFVALFCDKNGAFALPTSATSKLQHRILKTSVPGEFVAIIVLEAAMAQMTPEVSKLLKQALTLSVEEQEALADSLISNLGGKVDEGVEAAWREEIEKRIADLDSGKAKTIPWEEVRRRNLAKLPHV